MKCIADKSGSFTGHGDSDEVVARKKYMSRISDLQTKLKVLRCCGIAPDDLIAALRVIEQSSAVPDKRVLHCALKEDGNLLLIQTGEGMGGCMGGGCFILLEKNETGWGIAEIEGWRS